MSLSSDGSTLAVGSWYDGGLVGAAWVFKYDAVRSKYSQVGAKLVGTDWEGRPRQGKQ